MSDGYSIAVYPLNTLEGNPCVSDASISVTDSSNLFAIHNVVNSKYVSSGEKELLSERFDKNIFFCCLESGAAMFSFVPSKSGVSMKGLYIPKSDLRIAWRVFLPYLIYLFVMKKGTLTESSMLSFEKFRDYVFGNMSRLTEQSKAYADEIIKKMRKHYAPFSFCATRLPASMILGDFENLAAVSTDDADTVSSELVFDKEIVTRTKATLMSTNREVMETRFCRTSIKHFKELRKNEIKTLCQKQYQKEMLKELDNLDDTLEYIWYFSFNEKYFIPLENSAAHQIESHDGMISFEQLQQQMVRASERMISRRVEYQDGKQSRMIVQQESFEDFEARSKKDGAPSTPPFPGNATSGKMSSVSAKHKPEDPESRVDRPAKDPAMPEERDRSDKTHKGFFGLFNKK